MEYAYAALLLHESGEELNEENISRVLDAARVEVEESRVKALVAALEDVNIEEAISAASAGEVAEPEEPEEPVIEEEEGEGEEGDGEDDESLGDLFN